jgi:hypothetical protein
MDILVPVGSPSAGRAAATRASAATGRRSERWVAIVVGLCAAGPIIASTLRALIHGWIPAGDQAIIATRAYEVFTSRFPLVGQYSDSSAVTHHAVYSLGPMLYWLLAIPARIAAPGSLALTMGLANTAAVVGAVVLARRRGGLTLMFATALAVVLMTRSLSPEGLHDVWNPSAGLFPFTLLLFLCWSLACGEYRLLPLSTLVASFVVQLQLAFLLPSLGAFAVGLAGLVVSLRSSRRDRPARRATGATAPIGALQIGYGGGRAARGLARAAPRHVSRWVLAAVLVAVLCWTAPVVQQLTGHPGNVSAIARTVRANHSTLGPSVGWHAVVHAIGIPPWWLGDPASPWEHKTEVRTAPGALATGSAILVLCGLLVLAACGLVRRRVDLWAGALIGVALCVAIAIVAAETPTSHLLSATLGYTLWWASPAGMFVWLILASVPLAAMSRRGLPLWLGRPAAYAAGVGVVVLAAVAVAAGERPDEHLAEYRPLGKLSAALGRNVPHGRTVQLLGALGNSTFRFKMAARFALVRRGVRPLSPGSDTRLGSWYELGHRRYDCTVYLQEGGRRPDRRAVRITGFTFDRTYPVSVWMWPAGCPRAPA